MLHHILRPEIRDLIERRDWMGLREALASWPAPEIADLLGLLPKAERVLLFRALDRKASAEVFAQLDTAAQDALLGELTDLETRKLLAELTPDDRTHLLEELPAEVTQRLLAMLSAEDREEARWLLGYPEESVGRLMTPDYVTLRSDWTVADALAHIRRTGSDRETLNVQYVTDAGGRLLGMVRLRHLVLAEPGTPIADLLEQTPSIEARADRETAVRMFERYDLGVLPVVDEEERLLGIVTVDDALDVARAETTEDFHRGASVGPIPVRLRDAPLALLYRRRIVWLLALVGINIFSGAGLAWFEDTIAATVALVFFLPLLIDSAGNAGSQSATLIVRAMAMGEVHARDWLLMLGKELGVSLLLGLTMAAAVSGLGLYRGGPGVAIVVSLTMLLVVVLGSVTGLALPFLLSRFRLDPATASAPLITSLADIGGVMVYFSLARLMLG